MRKFDGRSSSVEFFLISSLWDLKRVSLMSYGLASSDNVFMDNVDWLKTPVWHFSLLLMVRRMLSP